MTGKNSLWRWIRPAQYIHRFLYAIGLGPVLGRIILLLTTTGRKSGRRRVTPVQYEEIDGVLYVGSARGSKADWVRNIAADPCIEVRIKNRRFHGIGELITDLLGDLGFHGALFNPFQSFHFDGIHKRELLLGEGDDAPD